MPLLDDMKHVSATDQHGRTHYLVGFSTKSKHANWSPGKGTAKYVNPDELNLTDMGVWKHFTFGGEELNLTKLTFLEPKELHGPTE